MNLSHTPDLAFARRRGGSGVAEQIAQQIPQIHPPVEAVGEGAKVLAGVLAKLEGLVGSVDHGLEVAQDCVDPGELRHLTRQALAHHDVGMSAARVDHPGKAAQAVTAYIATGHQVDAGPVGDGLSREARDRAHLDPHRMACIAGGHRRHDGHLVGRPTATYARALAPKVGVIDLDETAQGLLDVAQGHGLHQLLVDQPGRAVGGTQVALERQGRQSGLVLADQKDRQEPRAQRQLGAVHQRASRQRGLMPATAALVELACPMSDHVVRLGRTARTTKALRPAQRCQSRRTLRFGAVALEELRHRHAWLELDLIHRHRWIPWVAGDQITRSLAQGMSLAEVHDESGEFLSELEVTATLNGVSSASNWALYSLVGPAEFNFSTGQWKR